MIFLEGARSRERLLAAGAIGSGVVALLLGLLVAPAETVQGEAQRLMYLHVPAAWVAYLAFAVVLVASIGAQSTSATRVASSSRSARIPAVAPSPVPPPPAVP